MGQVILEGGVALVDARTPASFSPPLSWPKAGVANAMVKTERAIKGADKLAEYLARIQTRSSKYPYLDGTWFRAFDYDRWEAWGSSGDVGWGAWCIEAGWAQAWGAAMMGLRERKTTLWELTSSSRIADHMEEVQKAMSGNDGQPWRQTE